MNSITVTYPFQPYLHGYQPAPPVDWREWEVRDNAGDYRTADELERILASHPDIPTEPGEAVIYLYTQSGNIFSSLNESLRRRIPLPIALRFRDLLNASLRMLPADPALAEEPLYRRIQIDTEQELKELFERYKPDSIVTEHAFTSTSRGGVKRKYQKRTVEFVILSHSGRDISKFSASPREREVLIPAGARFKVEWVWRAGLKGLSRIELVEVR